MTTYESKVKKIASAQQRVFDVISDLNNFNLDGATEQINDNRLKELRIENDTLYIKVDMVGEIGLQLIEKEEPKTLKFKGVNAPMELFFWIQLKEVSDSDTRIKLTLKANIPMMIKPMASKPINEFLEKLSEALAQRTY